MGLSEFFQQTRQQTLDICSPLATEDFVIQTMPDVSPPKWHLGHTTWFFERVVLEEFAGSYRAFDPLYYYLFNSYYESFEERIDRPRRGTVSRPTVQEVLTYREVINQRMQELLGSGPAPQVRQLVEIGLHHEQQHQELLFMDLKNILAASPSWPAYRRDLPARPQSVERPAKWIPIEAGNFSIGHEGSEFSYDQEGPRHQVYLSRAEVQDRPISNAEFEEFIRDGGYEKAEYWLDEGWSWLKREGVRAPLYWDKDQVFSLAGRQSRDPHAPVCHVSFHEAYAYATWKGARLPTEAEWEVLARQFPPTTGFLEEGTLQPRGREHPSFHGDIWEWTGSAFLPYPGYQKPEKVLGEYNSKFMSSQMVLRGGCCVTPRSHYRLTYRNFYYPHQRWQFSGFRLARSA